MRSACRSMMRLPLEATGNDAQALAFRMEVSSDGFLIVASPVAVSSSASFRLLPPQLSHDP